MTQIIDDLLLGTANGSPAAFTELDSLVRERLIALAVTVVRDRGLAEDVVQEVLADVWARADRFDPERGGAVPWLLRLTHGRAIDRVRAEEHDRARASEWGARVLVDCDDTADERLDLDERLGALRSALAELSAIQREALVATHIEGSTYKDVAERIGVPIGTVKTRAHDAMVRLRELLGVPGIVIPAEFAARTLRKLEAAPAA